MLSEAGDHPHPISETTIRKINAERMYNHGFKLYFDIFFIGYTSKTSCGFKTVVLKFRKKPNPIEVGWGKCETRVALNISKVCGR